MIADQSIREKILKAYELMAESYNEKIDHKPHNAYYDRPNTLSLMGDVSGKMILDAACGPGKYAEVLMEKGAIVTGFDLSPKMIALAKTRNSGKGVFFVHDMTQPIDRVEDESFDMVLCALALHYVKNWNLVLSHFNRVLKPNGQLILSIEHPFFNYLYFKSEHYFEIEHVAATWTGFGSPIEVNGFRRSLGDCISPLTESGFYIDKLLEPKPTPEFEELDPRHFNELNEFPSFLCIRAIKKS